jgi:heme-degrading monooxygenase HmoA
MANIIVLFEVTPTKEGMQKYLDLAAMLKPMLAGFEGFIRAERFSSLNEEGKLLSMNVWTDEAAVERWRNVMQHRMSQKKEEKNCSKAIKSQFAQKSVPIQTKTVHRHHRIQMHFLRCKYGIYIQI